MKITKLIISDDYRDLYSETFERLTLIWSNDNSSGKTTLIRFILFAMGFDVPSTKKINMKKYNVQIELECPKKIFIKRRNMDLTVSFVEEGVTKKFDLDEELESAHSFIFGLNNKKMINNILGCFYIDQDKGWTLLNRGKVISSDIRFNIEDFILGVSNCDTSWYDVEINKKEKEISRYTAILNIVALSEEQQTGYKEDEIITKLKCEKSNLLFSLYEVEHQINDLRRIINNNALLIETIESYKIRVRTGENKKVLVTKENIEDFNLNQFILESQVRELQLRKNELENMVFEVNSQLSEYDTLVQVDEISQDVINKVKSVSLNQTQIVNLIESLKKEKSELEKSKRNLLNTQVRITTMLSEKIKEYASELGIFDGYIDKEKDYLKTRNLKEHSGALYHKATLCYRLSYYNCVKEILGISLPFIVDSPGSAEVKDDGLVLMVNLIKRVIGDGQIIMSSIYDTELSFGQEKKIILENGIFGDNV